MSIDVVSPLRQRMIEDMAARKLSAGTKRLHISSCRPREYEAAFRENEIDETILPSLTHETLKELGVTAVGHRLKLLDAIAALRTDAGNKAPLATWRPRPVPRGVPPKTAPSAAKSL